MNADRLRELMEARGLTRADVAAATLKSIKTVDSWLADTGSPRFRGMPDSALQLLELQLKPQRKGRK